MGCFAFLFCSFERGSLKKKAGGGGCRGCQLVSAKRVSTPSHLSENRLSVSTDAM